MPEPAIPILVIRDQRVILDADLARLYGVPTKRLNEQVKRNADRFPEDFVFQLSAGEVEALGDQTAPTRSPKPNRSQIVTASPGAKAIRSQIATASKRNMRFLPYVFTEHGALQAANVIRTPEAVKMSLFVIRAFVKIREELTATSALMKRLAQIDDTLFFHDKALRDLYGKLRPLLAPPPDPPPKPRIGFNPDNG